MHLLFIITRAGVIQKKNPGKELTAYAFPKVTYRQYSKSIISQQKQIRQARTILLAFL